MTYSYLPPEAYPWTGRPAAADEAAGYWYQCVRLTSMNTLPPGPGVVLLGYACEAGVVRNHGRAGAAAGPAYLRPQLARVAWQAGDLPLWDGGDYVCTGDQLEACQQALARGVALAHRQGHHTLVLGGGHDLAWGHLQGLVDSWGGRPPRRLGILNLDAHLDLRPLTGPGHSGTPFQQAHDLLTSRGLPFAYLAVGLQPQANTAGLLAHARALGADWLTVDDCQDPATWPGRVQAFLDHCDALYLSLDLDGFASPYAPGVSAPSPLGLTPPQGVALIRQALASGKVRACGIAELSPPFDQDGATARLAARLADEVVQGWASHRQ